MPPRRPAGDRGQPGEDAVPWVIPCDCDTDPGHFAANVAAQQYLLTGDLHGAVARRLAGSAPSLFNDPELAWALPGWGGR